MSKNIKFPPYVTGHGSQVGHKPSEPKYGRPSAPFGMGNSTINSVPVELLNYVAIQVCAHLAYSFTESGKNELTLDADMILLVVRAKTREYSRVKLANNIVEELAAHLTLLILGQPVEERINPECAFEFSQIRYKIIGCVPGASVEY